MRPRFIPNLLALLALSAAYAVLAAIHTFPLILHLDSHLTGTGLGDNVSFVWNLWWMREALASPAHDYFTCPLMAWPVGASVLLHTHTAVAAFAGATVLAPLSIVAAQNVLILASLVLNGLGACLLAYTVSGARWPSIVAGALVLTTPALTMRLMGHYNLLLLWPLLLACTALVRWWRAPTWRAGMLLGATAALVPYAEAYYAVYFGLFALLYSATALWGLQLRVEGRNRRTASRVFFVLAALAAAAALAIALTPDTALDIASVRISLRSPDNALTLAWACLAAGALTHWRIRATTTRRPTPAPRHDLTDGTTGRAPQTGRLAAILPVTVPSVTILSVAVPVVIAAVLAAPLAVPAWTLWRSGDYVTQPSSLKSSPRGVDAATLVMGPPFSGIVGTSVRRAYARYGIDAMESSAWLGLAPLILLVLALRAAPRDEKTRGREEPRRDEEPWCNEEIRRWAVIGGAFGLWALGPYLTVLGHNTGLLLPEALARAIPIVNNARMPARAMALVAVAAAVVGAVAVARRRPSRASTWALSSVAALALLETLAAPLPLVAVPAPGVYARLAAGPSAGAVLTLPFGVRDGFLERGHMEHDALLGQTVHGRPLVGGFLARLSPRVWTWYESTEPFAALLALSEGGSPDTLPSCAAVLAGLRDAAVSTVVAYPTHMPPRLAAFVSSHMPLTRVDSDDTRVVYNIDTAGCMP